MMEALKVLKTPFNKPYNYRQWIEEAGFVNIQEVKHDVTLSYNENELIRLLKDMIRRGLKGLSLKLYTEVLG